VAPNFKEWMPHAIHPLVDSGILLTSVAAVLLNVFFNGAPHNTEATVAAARQADAH
jgi:xanthine/uracil permease